jgi:hypothetical protein
MSGLLRASVFAKRRIGLCGESGRLRPDAASLCEAVGEALVTEPNVLLVTAGAKGSWLGRTTMIYSADWHYIVGARRRLEQLSQSERDRIETVLPDAAEPAEGYFEAGVVHRARGRTPEARRFLFVRHVQALVAVAGGKGTRQLLTLATALDLPILPFPAFGGAAAEHWEEHRTDIRQRLRLRDDDVDVLESKPNRMKAAAIADLMRHIVAGLGRRCFVIMPFADEFSDLYDNAIGPAVEAVGDIPVRLDRLQVPGELSRQIEDGIAAADYVIAVLDGLKPNVLYELGLARGYRKPAILLRRRGPAAEEVPFDLATQQRVEYGAPDATIIPALAAAISGLSQIPRE